MCRQLLVCVPIYTGVPVFSNSNKLIEGGQNDFPIIANVTAVGVSCALTALVTSKTITHHNFRSAISVASSRTFFAYLVTSCGMFSLIKRAKLKRLKDGIRKSEFYSAI